MTLEQAVAFALAADARWSYYLNAVGIDRWSPAASYYGSRAGELYEQKVIADRMMSDAFAKDRARVFEDARANVTFKVSCR